VRYSRRIDSATEDSGSYNFACCSVRYSQGTLILSAGDGGSYKFCPCANEAGESGRLVGLTFQ